MGKTIFRNAMGMQVVAILMGGGFGCYIIFLMGAGRPTGNMMLYGALVALGLPALLLLGMRFAQPDHVNEVVDRGDTLDVKTNSLGRRGAFSMPKGSPTKWGTESVNVQRVNRMWLAFEHEGKTYGINVQNPDYLDAGAFRAIAPEAFDQALSARAKPSA